MFITPSKEAAEEIKTNISNEGEKVTRKTDEGFVTAKGKKISRKTIRRFENAAATVLALKKVYGYEAVEVSKDSINRLLTIRKAAIDIVNVSYAASNNIDMFSILLVEIQKQKSVNMAILDAIIKAIKAYHKDACDGYIKALQQADNTGYTDLLKMKKKDNVTAFLITAKPGKVEPITTSNVYKKAKGLLSYDVDYMEKKWKKWKALFTSITGNKLTLKISINTDTPSFYIVEYGKMIKRLSTDDSSGELSSHKHQFKQLSTEELIQKIRKIYPKGPERYSSLFSKLAKEVEGMKYLPSNRRQAEKKAVSSLSDLNKELQKTINHITLLEQKANRRKAQSLQSLKTLLNDLFNDILRAERQYWMDKTRLVNNTIVTKGDFFKTLSKDIFANPLFVIDV